MKLLLDAGNTRLKWALTDNSELTDTGSCCYDDAQAWEAFLARLRAPDGIYLCSVAAASTNRQLMGQVERAWGLEATVLHATDSCCGVFNGYARPESLGVDRWAALVGGWSRHHGPLCVVDCGSAVTIDAIDGTGRHLGGRITPGYRMQLRVLEQQTAGVQSGKRDAEASHWGRATAECVHLGILESIAAQIERSVQQLQRQLRCDVKLVITGGDADIVIPRLTIAAIQDEYLVLHGVARIAQCLGE